MWVWIFFGIGIFVYIINTYPWVVPLLIIAVVSLGAYGIYKMLKPHLDEWEKKQEAERESIRKREELDRLPILWNDARFPTPYQFIETLIDGYLSLRKNKTVLHPPYLTQLVTQFSKLYEKEFPQAWPTEYGRLTKKLDDPEEAYTLFNNTFVEALVILTNHIAPECTEKVSTASPTLFTIRTVLSNTIITYDGDEAIWKPGQQEAFALFAEHFRKKQSEFEKLGLFTWHTEIYSPYSLPNSSDFAKTSSYEIAYERYRKAQDKAFDEIPISQRVFIHSPFYNIGPHFIPKQTTERPVSIPPETWFSSTWICAPQGKGKTNLLHNIVKDRAPHGTVILMDAKGELIGPYFDHATVIEPSLTNPPQINPLDIGSSVHAVELLEYLFSSLLEAQMTPKQSTLFSGVLTLLVTVPNATVETLRQVLQTGWEPYEKYVNALPKRDREFFTEGTFDSKGYSSTKEEVLWRLQLLLRNPYMAKMLEVPKTRLDMGKLMNSGKLIVINNNPDILGDLGAEFFGRFMLALVWNAVRARAHGGSKHPVYFFIDEAQTVISRDDNIPKLIHQCRSQKVALIFAHQELQQMKTDDVKGALGNCAIRLCAPDGETAVLAPRFRTTPEFLSALPKYHFAACIRDQPTIAVTVPEIKMPTKPRARQPKGNFDLHWDITISPKLAQNGGTHKLNETYSVKIPKGTKNGATLRLKGGGATKPDKSQGDLYLHITVPPHPNQRSIGHHPGPEEIG